MSEQNPLLKSLAEPPLNPQELRDLDQLLGSTQPIFSLHGATTAFLVSPDTPSLSPPEPLFSMHVQRFTQAPHLPTKKSTQWLRRFYNTLELTVTCDPVFLPLLDYQPLALEDFLENRLQVTQWHPLQRWCRAFLAHLHLDDWLKLAGDQIYALLDPIIWLSVDPSAEEPVLPQGISNLSAEALEEKKKSAISLFPQRIIGIFDFWRVQSPADSPLRKNTTRVITADASCPCLSGKTYAACCKTREPA